MLLTTSKQYGLITLFLLVSFLACLVAPTANAAPSELFRDGQKRAYVNLSSDQQLDLVLGYVLLKHPDQVVRYVSSPSDFQKDQLLSRPLLTGRDHVSLISGELFNNEHVILIIDYRQMAIPQIAELNSLLDETAA